MSQDTVLFISMHFHPEPTGSAPPISDLAYWLTSNGTQVKTFTTRPNYPFGRVFDSYERGARDKEIWEGGHIRRLPSWVSRKRGLFGRLTSELSFAAALFLYRVFRPSVVSENVLSVSPSVLTVLVAHLFRAKHGRHVVIVHDIQSGLGRAVLGVGPTMGLLRWLEVIAFNRVDHIVTLSEGMASTLRELGVKVYISVVPPQVNTTEIQPKEEPIMALPIVLYSGAFGRKQGLEQLIEAAAIVEKRQIPCRFVLRGHGGVEDRLRSAIETRGLKRVSIQPLRPRNKISDALADGVVHLVPQSPEGQEFAVPSKVFSIMSAGRPIVGTAREGSPLGRLVRASGAGMCVKPNRPEALADAIETLIADPSLRMAYGEAGRRYAVEVADREIICADLARIIMGPTSTLVAVDALEFGRKSL